MFRLFNQKTTLDRLREKYACLMRRSFQLALVNKEKSDIINQKACQIRKEIIRMENANKEAS